MNRCSQEEAELHTNQEKDDFLPTEKKFGQKKIDKGKREKKKDKRQKELRQDFEG